MSESERSEWAARGARGRAASIHARKTASSRLDGLAFGVTTERLLKVAIEGLDAKFEPTLNHPEGEIDYGARHSAALIFLHVFAPSLRATPEQARALLSDLLVGTKHAAVARIEAQEFYRAARREWFDVALRCDSLGSLYYLAVPPGLLGPWETPSSVRHEVPDVNEWKTLQLHDDAGRVITTFVKVVRPDGSEVLVQRDASIAQRDAA